MKKIIALGSIITAAALLAGCATPAATGVLYTGTMTGAGVGDAAAGTAKVGQACNNSYFSLIAVGDATIATAKANGHISRIATVDYTATNVLGIYGTYCVVVHGS